MQSQVSQITKLLRVQGDIAGLRAQQHLVQLVLPQLSAEALRKHARKVMNGFWSLLQHCAQEALRDTGLLTAAKYFQHILQARPPGSHAAPQCRCSDRSRARSCGLAQVSQTYHLIALWRKVQGKVSLI